MINEPAIAPLGEAPADTPGVSRARWPGWASTTPCFGRRRRGAGADRVPPGDGRRRRLRGAARAGLGGSSDIAEAPFAEGGFPSPTGSARVTSPASAFPIMSPTTNRRPGSRPRAPLPARDDLAAGAQLPQLEVRERHRLRAIEGEPVLEIAASDAAPRAHSRWPARSHLQRPRRASSARPRSASGRGRASSTASASGGGSSPPTARTATS